MKSRVGGGGGVILVAVCILTALVVFPMTAALSAASGSASPAGGSTPSATQTRLLLVSADTDDHLIFANPELENTIAAGDMLQVVIMSPGNVCPNGGGTCAASPYDPCGPQTTPHLLNDTLYWQRREQGTLAAIATMAGKVTAQLSGCEGWSYIEGLYSFSSQTVPGSCGAQACTIDVWTLKNTAIPGQVTVTDLRISSAYGSSIQMYPLEKLWQGIGHGGSDSLMTVGSVGAGEAAATTRKNCVPGSSTNPPGCITYTLPQLESLMKGIIENYQPTQIWMQDAPAEDAVDGGDHTDHIHTARVALQAYWNYLATNPTVVPSLSLYRGYYVQNLPDNVPTFPTSSLVQSPPIPSGATGVTLNAVSCWTTIACMGVGDYKGSGSDSGSTLTLAEGTGAGFKGTGIGSGWATVPTVNPSGANGGSPPTNVLSGISCPPANAGDFCMAVGSQTRSSPLPGDNPLVETFDGINWTDVSPTIVSGTQFKAVSCPSSSSCMAIGDENNVPYYFPWNGSTWNASPFPLPASATAAELLGVSCTSATSCFAVGDYTIGQNKILLVESWDGTGWTIQSSANPSGATYSSLQGISCLSSTTCTAVGFDDSSGTVVTLAEAWNGTSWAVQPTPNPTTSIGSVLFGVSCPSSTACIAVGAFNDNGKAKNTLAEAWQGNNWSLEPTSNPKDARGFTTQLNGISCFSGDNLTCQAVGGYANSSGNQVPLSTFFAPTKMASLFNYCSFDAVTFDQTPGNGGPVVIPGCYSSNAFVDPWGLRQYATYAVQFSGPLMSQNPGTPGCLDVTPGTTTGVELLPCTSSSPSWTLDNYGRLIYGPSNSTQCLTIPRAGQVAGATTPVQLGTCQLASATKWLVLSNGILVGTRSKVLQGLTNGTVQAADLWTYVPGLKNGGSSNLTSWPDLQYLWSVGGTPFGQ